MRLGRGLIMASLGSKLKQVCTLSSNTKEYLSLKFSGAAL